MYKISLEGDNIKGFLKDVADDEVKALSETLKQEISRRTPIDSGRARRGWQVRNNQVINNVPYIDRLERGYSSQAPKGFTNQAVRATVNKRKNK